MDTLERLSSLERFYDGIIPDPVRQVAIHGTAEMVALLQATGNATFYTGMARGQIDLIRKRRADGTFYPHMLSDLRLYVAQARKWRKQRQHFAAIVARQQAPLDVQTAA